MAHGVQKKNDARRQPNSSSAFCFFIGGAAPEDEVYDRKKYQ
jgi:hypothetical protein